MSATRIDHVAEADRLRVLANGYELANGTSESSDAALVVIGAVANGYAHAQVHATLALVEQQRIANLIAMAGLPAINGFEGEIQDAATETLMAGLLDSETVAAVPGYGPAGIEEHVFIRPEIREALGLA